MEFEWDEDKNVKNQRKHGIAFDDVCPLFRSAKPYLEIFDEDQSVHEERFIAIGEIQRGVIHVVWTERVEETVRIISARPATVAEISLYQRYIKEMTWTES